MKLFFSAGENPAHAKKIIGGGAKNILLSYYYIRKKRTNTIYAIENAAEGTEFMLDSGAHTIQKEDISGSNQEDFYNRYCEEYLNWVAKYGKKIARIVELDIEESTSLELVYKLQEKYFKPFEKESGKSVVYVWHKERGTRKWQDMCRDHNHLGLGQEDGIENRYRQMNQIAARGKATVHGFAMTKPEVMMKAGFYSVDSTSWLAAELYGCNYIWKGNRMIMLDKNNKGQRRVYKNYYLKLGLDYNKIMKEDALEIGKANVAAWVQCENFINKRTEKRQWWNDTSLDNIKTTEAQPIPKPETGNKPMTFKLRITKKTGNENGPQEERGKLDKRAYPIQDTQETTQRANMSYSPNGSMPIDPIADPITGVIPGSHNPSPTCPQKDENAIVAGDGRATNGDKSIIPMDDSDRARSLEARKTVHIETALVCNNCVALETCPNSKANSVCTLIGTFKRLESNNQYDCIHKIREIISVLEGRAWRNMYFEQLDGGVADKNNSSLMGDLVEYHKMLADLLKETLPSKDKVTIEGASVLAAIFGPARGAIDVTASAEDAILAPDAPNAPKTGKDAPIEQADAPNDAVIVHKEHKKNSLNDKLRQMLDKEGK